MLRTLIFACTPLLVAIFYLRGSLPRLVVVGRPNIGRTDSRIGYRSSAGEHMARTFNPPPELGDPEEYQIPTLGKVRFMATACKKPNAIANILQLRLAEVELLVRSTYRGDYHASWFFREACVMGAGGYMEGGRRAGHYKAS